MVEEGTVFGDYGTLYPTLLPTERMGDQVRGQLLAQGYLLMTHVCRWTLILARLNLEPSGDRLSTYKAVNKMEIGTRKKTPIATRGKSNWKNVRF